MPIVLPLRPGIVAMFQGLDLSLVLLMQPIDLLTFE